MHIQSFNNASRIVPYLIVDDLSREALIALKFHGIAIGFIKELFGQKYADTLKELISVLNNAGASLKSSPEKYLGLLRFWLIDPLTGIDIPNDLGKNRCKSNFALKLKFWELLFDFDSRSCNRW